MNFYLSSVGLPNKEVFRGLFDLKEKPVVGIIANAWDVYEVAKATPFIQSVSEELVKSGCTLESVDLRQFTDRSPKKIERVLDQLDGVWVTGGNTFYLAWLMRQSHFDTAIKSLVNKPFVYGGESAGAVITGPTLHGAQNIDDVKQAPMVIWEGLALVDFGIVPHWGEAKYAEKLEAFKAELAQYTRTIELANRHAVVVSAGSVTIST